MLPLHIALWVLLGTCVTFSIVELGLTAAYVATYWPGGSQQVPYYNAYAYGYGTVSVSTPGIVDFLLFTAVWSILASVAAGVLPWHYTRKGAVSASLNTVLGVSLSVIFIVTSIFWLACFADIASLLGGGISTSDNLNAVIAFAVLLWLLFLALFILSILALCGVMASTWVGYLSMRKTDAADAPASTAMPATKETHDVDHAAHDGYMGTPPSASSAPSAPSVPYAPSPPPELSSRDAGVMHHHSVRVLSASPPAAIHSFELSGESPGPRELSVSPA